MSAFAKGLAVLLSAAVLWGCTSTPDSAGAGDGGVAGMASEGTGAGDSGVTTGTADMGAEVSGAEIHGMGQGTAIESDPFSDPSNPLSTTVVYFDFDRSDIKPEARSIIEAHARYLAEHPDVRVTLEGHCDERGTREYNLGLGERRAKAVQQMMSLLGVSPRQMEVISYGEEKPAVLGHDESAWSKNRRVVIVYHGR